MAVSKGPGQQEVTGELKDARAPEQPGTYKDPVSGAELSVTMGAGADALVRMGWQLLDPREVEAKKKADEKAQEEATAAKAKEAQSKEDVTKKEDK